jgi:hypothetical protein
MRSQALFLLAAACAAQDLPEIAGVAVTPHVTTDETRYRGRSVPDGAWVQIVLRNPADRPLPAPTMVNGREPMQWVLGGEWSWMDAPRGVPAGGFAVLSFNGITPRWRPGAEIVLENHRRPWRASVRLEVPEVSLSKVAFFPKRGQVAIHFRNRSKAAVQLETVTLHTGAGFTRAIGLTRGLNAPAEAGGRGAGLWSAPELPSGYALVEATFSNQMKAWSLLRIKDDSFDIGAGWLDTRAPNGENPLQLPLFRSLLRRLHINLTHSQHDPAPDGRPFRRMSTFADIKKFSAAGEAASIHCADVVGEPQHSGLSPWEVWRRLKPYESGTFPTCLTLSEDLGFGFYAGLSDWPHFDAYRVNAPHADDWAGYERFGGLAWGAPLESIGGMTRVLREVSVPRPVAAWSQSAHYNWRSGMGGRKRLDPTPGEMAMQAWQAVANGAQSLYWYSLESYSALRSPDLLIPAMEIGRKLRVLNELLETGDATWHARQNGFDLNVVAAPEAAVLFAMDLEYRADADTKTFRWAGPRAMDAEFALPEWLRGEGVEVVQLRPSSIEKAQFQMTAGGVRLRGEADSVSIYILFRKNELRGILQQKLEWLIRSESGEGFDPANPEHLRRLSEQLGYPLY